LAVRQALGLLLVGLWVGLCRNCTIKVQQKAIFYWQNTIFASLIFLQKTGQVARSVYGLAAQWHLESKKIANLF
jgi:hypothetical protein